MKKSLIILLLISFIIMLIPPLIVDVAGGKKKADLDTVQVNQLMEEIEHSDGMVVTKTSGEFTFDYTIIDKHEKVLYSSTGEETESIVSATKRRDTIRDINKDGELVGWLVIHNRAEEMETDVNRYYAKMYLVSYIAIIVLWVGYSIWFYVNIIRPFYKMKDFAGAVATGNLDAPLEMDRKNVFGAFTESFDIMRDELATARQKEYEANVSKRELVAQLSHDIKTPVASIKAMSEVIEAKTAQSGDDFTNAKARSIAQKADQIDALVSNLFSSTLKELEQLEVRAIEVESTQIRGIIESADFNSRVSFVEIPECIILMDMLRANQVFTNIIYNSYKYAGTDIELESYMDSDFLYISFKDAGGGVPDEELPFIMDKFYRGKNADGIEGSGLGLNIARNLMQDMGGTIECKNEDGGFKVTLGFKIA